MFDLKPEHFDILGVIGFSYITIFSVYALHSPKPTPRWSVLVLLIIGLIGLTVDMTIVYTHFVK